MQSLSVRMDSVLLMLCVREESEWDQRRGSHIPSASRLAAHIPTQNLSDPQTSQWIWFLPTFS